MVTDELRVLELCYHFSLAWAVACVSVDWYHNQVVCDTDCLLKCLVCRGGWEEGQFIKAVLTIGTIGCQDNG